MRSLASMAALGTFLWAGGAYAQSLSEHAAAAAGATIGTAAGKPISNALSGIFGQVDESAASAAKVGAKAKAVKPTIDSTSRDRSAETNRAGGSGSFSPGFGGGSGGTANEEAAVPEPAARRRAAPLRATPAPVITPVAAPEPVKEPSLEDVANVKLGTTEKDLFGALGAPESRVVIPDDDGHVRESCQYWAQGKQLGTIRLDNGQVVRVEVRAKN
jgi:hypothetical protein